jgi:hypothetical protein
MPAKSQAQQRLMAVALHHPEALRPASRRVAAQMSPAQLRDYASTATRRLPARVKKAR